MTDSGETISRARRLTAEAFDAAAARPDNAQCRAAAVAAQAVTSEIGMRCQNDDVLAAALLDIVAQLRSVAGGAAMG